MIITYPRSLWTKNGVFIGGNLFPYLVFLKNHCCRIVLLLLKNGRRPLGAKKHIINRSQIEQTNSAFTVEREKERKIEWRLRIDRFKMKGFGLMAQTTVCVWEKERENILKTLAKFVFIYNLRFNVLLHLADNWKKKSSTRVTLRKPTDAGKVFDDFKCLIWNRGYISEIFWYVGRCVIDNRIVTAQGHLFFLYSWTVMRTWCEQ